MVAAASFLAVPAGTAHAATIYYRIINAKSDMCLNQNYSGGVPHHEIYAWADTYIPPAAENSEWILVQLTL